MSFYLAPRFRSNTLEQFKKKEEDVTLLERWHCVVPTNADVNGPLNAVAPNICTNYTLTKALGQVC